MTPTVQIVKQVSGFYLPSSPFPHPRYTLVGLSLADRQHEAFLTITRDSGPQLDSWTNPIAL